jgi:hypothetical protein
VGTGPNTDLYYLATVPSWLTPDVEASPYLEQGDAFYLAQTGQRQGEPPAPKKFFKQGWCKATPHMDSLRREVRWHEGAELGPRKSHHQEMLKYTQQNDAGPAIEGVAFLYSGTTGEGFDSVSFAAFNSAYYAQAADVTDVIVHAATNLFAVQCKAHLQ